MFGTFAFFVLAKENIAVKYSRPFCSSLVVLIMSYLYFRIFQSWDDIRDSKYGMYVWEYRLTTPTVTWTGC